MLRHALLFGVLGEDYEVFVGDDHHLFAGVYEAEVLFGHFFNVFGGGVVLEIGEFLVIFGFELRVAGLKLFDVFFNLVILVNGYGEVVEHVGDHKKSYDQDESHQVELLVVAFLEHFR